MPQAILVLLLAVVASAKRYEYPDLQDAELRSRFTDSDIQFILNNVPDLDDVVRQRLLAAAAVAAAGENNKEDEPVFPKLSDTQERFGIHPGYKSYYDPGFRAEEGLVKSDVNEEVASDPFSDGADRHQSPKKASYEPRAAGVYSRKVDEDRMNDIYFTTIVAVSSGLAVFAIVGAGFCYHRVRRNSKASEDVEYPAYGVTGPGKETSPTSGTDRKLAQNAQMYHYQHQKQQMLAFDSANGGSARTNGAAASDVESDDGEEGDYTVYECPGLAPAGEMEVHNPLFQDDPTPKAK